MGKKGVNRGKNNIHKSNRKMEEERGLKMDALEWESKMLKNILGINKV